MLSNNIWNGEDFRENRIYFLIRRKELNIMTVERLDILNKIADSNNSGHNNVFRVLYR